MRSNRNDSSCLDQQIAKLNSLLAEAMKHHQNAVIQLAKRGGACAGHHRSGEAEAGTAGGPRDDPHLLQSRELKLWRERNVVHRGTE